MKKIVLTRGQVAIVDDEDFEALSAHKWHTRESHGHFYAGRSVLISGKKRRIIYMQNQIHPPPPGLENDHKNHDTLDNRRHNLRHCTHSQNCSNRRWRKTESGYKGVQKRHNRFCAKIGIGNRKILYLGCFETAVAAAKAYDRAAKELYGEFAKTNGV